MAKPTITWIIIFLTAWLLVGCGSPEVTAITASQGLSLEIPRAEQPILDGTISPREWSGAYQTELSGGGELLLITADGYLFLGIRGKPEPVISICLDRGREVAILHSSAAIGTAIYKQGENTWDQVQGFTWSNRGREYRAHGDPRRCRISDRNTRGFPTISGERDWGAGL
jgi:hypothetical protein